jgi:hypothetical protein
MKKKGKKNEHDRVITIIFISGIHIIVRIIMKIIIIIIIIIMMMMMMNSRTRE